MSFTRAQEDLRGLARKYSHKRELTAAEQAKLKTARDLVNDARSELHTHCA